MAGSGVACGTGRRRTSRVDEQARSVDVAQHDAVFLDLQEFLGVNVSLILPLMLTTLDRDISLRLLPA